MIRRCVLLGLMMGVALLLGSCQLLPNEKPGPTQAPGPTQTPEASLTYLYFSESASYFKRVLGYEFREEEGKYTAVFCMANEEENYPVAVDQAWVDMLKGFVRQYDMQSWNGFRGSAPGLLDGTRFQVECTFSDGSTIQASGYGRFPPHYRDASKAIEAHFMQLLPEEMR